MRTTSLNGREAAQVIFYITAMRLRSVTLNLNRASSITPPCLDREHVEVVATEHVDIAVSDA
jgi:hypothetical protein